VQKNIKSLSIRLIRTVQIVIQANEIGQKSVINNVVSIPDLCSRFGNKNRKKIVHEKIKRKGNYSL
jgi:hypothetical protein